MGGWYRKSHFEHGEPALLEQTIASSVKTDPSLASHVGAAGRDLSKVGLIVCCGLGVQLVAGQPFQGGLLLLLSQKDDQHGERTSQTDAGQKYPQIRYLPSASDK